MASPDEPEAPAPARFPRRFGDRYVLLKPLGEGGMGEVFMAVSGRAGISRVCALKIVRNFQPDRDAEDLTQRFLDEAKVVTQLSHENLVYVFDFGIVDRKGYLGMEYVAGKTLTEVWNRCAQNRVGFPTGVGMFLISELVAALGYAHRLGGLGLVHRDISPSNLMIAYTGGVKLIDFGLAKWTSKISETATGINWGKINYMSPEQHHGRDLDHRSDLFSAGVILWELLTGRQLFPTAKSRAETKEIPPPSRFNAGISAGLDQVVLRALSPAPVDRFQTGEQMSAAIAAELPRHAGKRQVADFLERLFATDRQAEEADQEAVLARAVELGDHMPNGLASDSSGNTDPLVGAVLADRYFVRRCIGQGAMGRVYEGHHTGVGKRVAIKVPRHAERRKDSLVQRFRREAQAASQIGHPNIADVTDCGTTASGDFFFVMEFVDGVDLEKLVKRDGALPLERALVIGLQIARALEAAHHAGIIHRDLKPSNVMLVRGRDEAELVKVLDFGVAKFLRGDTGVAQGDPASAELTQHDAAVGTPRYMAPEQIGAGQEVDFRADIYAVGGILYSMLSGGRAPVEGDDIQSVWQRKLSEDPTPLSVHRPDLPEELETLVMKCLARDPSQRPSAMSALKAQLVSCLERIRAMGSSVVAMKMPSQTAVVAGRRWRGVMLLAGGTAASAVLGAATWLWWQGKTPLIAVEIEDPPPLSTSLHLPAPPVVPPAPPPAPASIAIARLPAPPPVVARPIAPQPRRVARPPAAPEVTEVDRLLEESEAEFQKGRLVAAVYPARKAARLGGGARAWLKVGKIELASGEFPRAAEAYQEALRMDPKSVDARKGLDRVRAALASQSPEPAGIKSDQPH